MDVALNYSLDEVQAQPAEVEPQLADRDRRPTLGVDPNEHVVGQHRQSGEENNPADQATDHRNDPRRWPFSIYSDRSGGRVHGGKDRKHLSDARM